MSHSRKKVYINDFSQLSITEKLRGTPKNSLFKRKCCDKENQCSRQCKSKDESKSLKKQTKKKYLEQEVQKVLQKRYFESGNAIKELRERNSNEIQGLKEDLKSMKDVIFKLSTEDAKNLHAEPKKIKKSKEQETPKRINDVKQQLQIQKDINAKLQETRIQLQLFVKETNGENQSIKIKLSELTAKHSKCLENLCQLEQSKKQIRESEIKERQLESQLNQAIAKEKQVNKSKEELIHRLKIEQSEKKSLKSELQQNQTQLSKLNEEIQSISSQISQKKSHICRLQFENQKLIKQKKLIEQQYLQKLQQSEKKLKDGKLNESKLTKECQKVRQQLNNIKDKYKVQSSAKVKLEQQMKKMQIQLNKTSIDLGNTKIQLGGLSSMEKKCEELFEQIKKQKLKWNQFTSQKSSQRQLYQSKLATTRSEKNSLQSELVQLENRFKQEIQTLKVENYRLFEDKIKLCKEIKMLQSNRQKFQQQEFSMLEKKAETLQNTLKQYEVERVKERLRLENQIEILQKQRKDIEKEVKSTLETAKQRNDQIQLIKIQLQKQILKVQQEKDILQEAISNRQKQISILQAEKLQLHSTLKIKQEEIIEFQSDIESYQSKFNRERNEMIEKEKIIQDKNEVAKSQNNKIEELMNKVKTQKQEINKNQTLIQHQITVIEEERNEKQRLSQNNIELSEQVNEIKVKLQKSESLLQNHVENSTKNDSKVRITIIQLEQQHQTLKIKLQMTQKQAQEWRQKNQVSAREKQTQRLKKCEYEQKWRQAESLQLSLSSELHELQQSSQRNQEQLEWYSQEISLKNKSIVELKETLRIVKNESILIKEEVETYRSEFESLQYLKEESSNRSIQTSKKYEELQSFTMNQIHYMRERLEELSRVRVDLQAQIEMLQRKNYELQQKIIEIDNQNVWHVEKEEYERKIRILNEESDSEKRFYKQQIKKLSDTNQAFSKELQIKGKQLQMLNSILEEQRSSFSQRLLQVESQSHQFKFHLESQTQVTQQYTKSLTAKQEEIKKLTEKITSFQEKRMKVIDEVHFIQSELAQLNSRNNLLESDNQNLEQQKKQGEQKMRIYEQKINLLMEGKYALEEQKTALQDQLQLLQQEISKGRNREKTIQEQSNKKINEIYESCERKTSEAVSVLKQKIREITNELSYIKNQSMVQERGEKQRLISINLQLNAQVQSLKQQIAAKDRQHQCSLRESSIIKEKLTDIESKYELVGKRYEQSEYERSKVQREIENQSATLRVLREENRNIEKVMSDQLNQRTAIIEQLVSEKRMLYTQFQHQ